jgi:hypothetical protein
VRELSRATGRSEEHCRPTKIITGAGLWGIPKKATSPIRRNWNWISPRVPSVAGPKRPQDRIELPKLKQEFIARFQQAGHGKWLWHEGGELSRTCMSPRRRIHPGGGSHQISRRPGKTANRPSERRWRNIRRPIRFTPRPAGAGRQFARLGA